MINATYRNRREDSAQPGPIGPATQSTGLFSSLVLHYYYLPQHLYWTPHSHSHQLGQLNAIMSWVKICSAVKRPAGPASAFGLV